MENSKNVFKVSNFSKDFHRHSRARLRVMAYTLKFTGFHCPRLGNDSLSFLIYGNGQFSIIPEAMSHYHENHFTMP